MKKSYVVLLGLLLMFAGLVWSQTSAPPTLATSEVSMDTGNGFGSTGLYARRFSNVDVNVGSDITLTQSATNGDSFTINTNGICAISYTNYSANGDTSIISLNSSGATTTNSLTVANRLCAFSMSAGQLHSCSITLGLSSGDVIRAHSSTAGQTDGNDYVRFVITRVR